MATFFKRYLPDIAVFLACLGFGALVFVQAAHQRPPAWGADQTALALAGR